MHRADGPLLSQRSTYGSKVPEDESAQSTDEALIAPGLGSANETYVGVVKRISLTSGRSSTVRMISIGP